MTDEYYKTKALKVSQNFLQARENAPWGLNCPRCLVERITLLIQSRNGQTVLKPFLFWEILIVLLSCFEYFLIPERNPGFASRYGRWLWMAKELQPATSRF
jgi:hypothetical protein